MPGSITWLAYSRKRAPTPAATTVAVELPSLRIVRVDAWYPGSKVRFPVQAPETASPRALYFSSPENGGLKADGLPKPSAEPMQKIP